MDFAGRAVPGTGEQTGQERAPPWSRGREVAAPGWGHSSARTQAGDGDLSPAQSSALTGAGDQASTVSRRPGVEHEGSLGCGDVCNRPPVKTQDQGPGAQVLPPVGSQVPRDGPKDSGGGDDVLLGHPSHTPGVLSDRGVFLQAPACADREEARSSGMQRGTPSARLASQRRPVVHSSSSWHRHPLSAKPWGFKHCS